MASQASAPSPASLLLISRSYPPVLGGSEIEAQRVCAALLKRGYRVTVLCAGGPPMPDQARWTDPAGVPVRIFARRWRGALQDRFFGLAVAWTLLRERRRYQLVYFLMQGIHLALGLPVARALGKSIVMKVSGSNLISLMQKSWMGRLELRWLKKWAYRVMILNPGMAEEAAGAGFDPAQLYWMPNPVDTEEFSPCAPEARQALRAGLEVPADGAVVVYVGRLAPEKELPSLIGAFSRVVRQTPHALLVLVGDGPERQGLESQVQHLGMAERVRFCGRQPVAEVRKWLQAGDIFALVSRYEGFPCSLAEAMAAGLPSVVSGIPANAQLIDPGVHGLHAALGDEESIAEAMLELIRDDGLRARMGATARQRVVEHYATDKVADRYDALIREALAGVART